MNITTQNMRALFTNVLLGLATIVAVLAVIGGGWSFAKYSGILPLKRTPKALTIDETPVTVENIKAIGELVTATYYDEMVVIVRKSDKKDARGNRTVVIERVPEQKAKEENSSNLLVTIQKAHARIGIDLAKLTGNDLKVSPDGKSVDVVLPDPECLDFIMNPTDIEIFSEAGKWVFDDLKKAVAPAREEMEAYMNKDSNLSEKARKGAKDVLTQLLKAAGYEKVDVTFASDRPIEFKLPELN